MSYPKRSDTSNRTERTQHALVLGIGLRLLDLPEHVDPQVADLGRQPVEHLRAARRYEVRDAHRRQLAQAWLGHVVELRRRAGRRLRQDERERQRGDVEAYPRPPLVEDGLPDLSLGDVECGGCCGDELEEELTVRDRDTGEEVDVFGEDGRWELVRLGFSMPLK